MSPPAKQDKTTDESETRLPIESAIPYLPYLKYENGVMLLKPPESVDPLLESVEVRLVDGTIQDDKQQEIFDKAKALWPESSHSYLKVENLLHLIRMIKFKPGRNPPYSNDEEARKELDKVLKSVVNLTGKNDKNLGTKICQRELQEIQCNLDRLKKESKYRYLLEDEATQNLLIRQKNELQEYMTKN